MLMKQNAGPLAKVLVVGSSNTDMVVKTERLPAAGETLLGGAFFMNAGGKGANQAVAAARLGASVTFIGKTGNDVFGEQTRQLLSKEGIDTRHLLTDPVLPSGVALITVNAAGENCIVVASGANGNLMPEDMPDIRTVLEACDIVVLQLEIPLETVIYVAKEASRMGKKVILNPAPARVLPPGLLPFVFLITPNETEAQVISGIDTAGEEGVLAAARKLADMGSEHVIITRGGKGALIYSGGVFEWIAPVPVKAVDTTAAGDVFTGALAVRLAEGSSLLSAALFAASAAAISVTRQGALTSAPYREEIAARDAER
ncbi:ribokinase [Chitinophaga parva]|nr:ribokinase [Chitinophaga parva]